MTINYSGTDASGNKVTERGRFVFARNSDGWLVKSSKLYADLNGNIGIGVPGTTELLTVGGNGAFNGGYIILGDTSFSNSVTLSVSDAGTDNITITLPPDTGSKGQCLTTDGTGVTSWSIPIPELGGIGSIVFAGITGDDTQGQGNYYGTPFAPYSDPSSQSWYGLIANGSTIDTFNPKLGLAGAWRCHGLHRFQTGTDTASDGSYSYAIITALALWMRIA